MSESTTHLSLRQQRDYQFVNRFEGVDAELLSDEPAPLGQGGGPSPLQLLGAAVGNCLASSLLFALRKFKQRAEPIGCEVQVDTARNAEKRLRVGAIGVRLTLGTGAGEIEHLDRILGSFEDFCTVTASIRQGIAAHRGRGGLLDGIRNQMARGRAARRGGGSGVGAAGLGAEQEGQRRHRHDARAARARPDGGRGLRDR